jgi:hypothetical protein
MLRDMTVRIFRVGASFDPRIKDAGAGCKRPTA